VVLAEGTKPPEIGNDGRPDGALVIPEREDVRGAIGECQITRRQEQQNNPGHNSRPGHDAKVAPTMSRLMGGWRGHKAEDSNAPPVGDFGASMEMWAPIRRNMVWSCQNTPFEQRSREPQDQVANTSIPRRHGCRFGFFLTSVNLILPLTFVLVLVGGQSFELRTRVPALNGETVR